MAGVCVCVCVCLDLRKKASGGKYIFSYLFARKEGIHCATCAFKLVIITINSREWREAETRSLNSNARLRKINRGKPGGKVYFTIVAPPPSKKKKKGKEQKDSREGNRGVGGGGRNGEWREIHESISKKKGICCTTVLWRLIITVIKMRAVAGARLYRKLKRSRWDRETGSQKWLGEPGKRGWRRVDSKRSRGELSRRECENRRPPA